MSHHFAKPVNALRKANDLVKVDKDDAALRILHNMLLSRRYRTWQNAHEEIMMLYIQLATKNRKNAKDGLLQYRIICQTANIDSLEKIIREFCRLAEAKADEAHAEAEEAEGTEQTEKPTEEAEVVEELDDELGFRPSVNRYFVPGVGGEDEQDRSKRRLVTPWLKYLWDTYRTVLDVMRNNAKLDFLYHETVIKALDYCTKHNRTSEFRRLCEIMRIHMNAINTHQGQANSIDISEPASIKAYLKSRFLQLEVASKLDLWQEAYRIIEDIHDLLQRSHTALDASLLSIYYSRLEVVFWKSDNTLFHAYCMHKLYSFAVSSGASEDSVKSLADRLVLAALVIPPRANTSQRLDYLDSEDQKNMRLADMLGFEGPPSRARLLKQLRSDDVVAACSTDVQDLFAMASSSVAPRALSAKMSPLLASIRAREGLSVYISGLVDMVVLTLLQQLSKVYRVMLFDSFISMLPADIDRDHVERVVIRRVRERHARVRVDHSKQRLMFDQNEMETPRVQTMLSKLSLKMGSIEDKVRSVLQPDYAAEKELQRAQVFQCVKHGMDQEHRDVFIRKQVIEKRKQEHELALQRHEHEEKVRLREKRERLAEEERKRLAEEREKRERERVERIEKEAQLAKNKILMEKLKEQTEAASVKSRKIIEKLEDNLENVNQERLLEAQSEVALEEQRARERKQRDEAKRIDYFTRALRIEERPLLEKAYDQQREEDKAYYDAQWAAHLKKHRDLHEFCLQEKVRLARLQPHHSTFVAKIMQRRQAVFDKLKDEQDERERQREAERAAAKAKYEAEERRREQQRLEELEREQLEREEQERKEREAAERSAKIEAERRERDENLRRTAELQRKREAEIEARKRAEREQRSRPASSKADTGVWRPSASRDAAPASSSSSNAWRPRPATASGSAAPASASSEASETRSWRSSRAAAAAGSASSAQSTSSASTPSGRGDQGAWRRRGDTEASSSSTGGSSASSMRQQQAPRDDGGSSWRRRSGAAAPAPTGRRPLQLSSRNMPSNSNGNAAPAAAKPRDAANNNDNDDDDFTRVGRGGKSSSRR